MRVLITGAARGLGAELARALAAQGAQLALLGLEGERLRELAGEAHFWREVCVTDEAAMQSAVEAAVDQLGGLDVVIANAGVGRFALLEDSSSELLRRTMDVNFFGTWHTMRACLPALLESRGYFLAVASGAAAVPLVGMNGYNPSKAAQEALCNTLRLEMAGRGVGVGVAYFSFLDTELVAEARRTPGFDVAFGNLPFFLRRVFPVSLAVDAILRGIRRRSSQVVAPRALWPLLWLRWWLCNWLTRVVRVPRETGLSSRSGRL